MMHQDPAELIQFTTMVKMLNVRRYLEIGSRNGESFNAVMSAIGPGGYGVTVDISETPMTRRNLMAVSNNLRVSGITIKNIFGSSQDTDVILAAQQASPFDLVLIDADHRYAGVKADWDNYSGMATVVALHDVDAPRDHMSDGHVNDVKRLWHELKPQFKHQEIITPGSKMGFGVIYK